MLDCIIMLSRLTIARDLEPGQSLPPPWNEMYAEAQRVDPICREQGDRIAVLFNKVYWAGVEWNRLSRLGLLR